MAKQRYGINDGYRGAVGTVIGYQWRGKWCLRAKPRFVRNPRTERQQENRGLFAAASRMASRMGEALRVGLHEVSLEHHRPPCNHFLSINKDCFSLEDGRLAVDFGRLAVSQGPVAPVGFQQPTVAGGHVTVPFEKNPLHLRADSDDKVYLYAWCRELDEGLLSVPAYAARGRSPSSCQCTGRAARCTSTDSWRTSRARRRTASIWAALREVRQRVPAGHRRSRIPPLWQCFVRTPRALRIRGWKGPATRAPRQHFK